MLQYWSTTTYWKSSCTLKSESFWKDRRGEETKWVLMTPSNRLTTSIKHRKKSQSISNQSKKTTCWRQNCPKCSIFKSRATSNKATNWAKSRNSAAYTITITKIWSIQPSHPRIMTKFCWMSLSRTSLPSESSCVKPSHVSHHVSNRAKIQQLMIAMLTDLICFCSNRCVLCFSRATKECPQIFQSKVETSLR